MLRALGLSSDVHAGANGILWGDYRDRYPVAALSPFAGTHMVMKDESVFTMMQDAIRSYVENYADIGTYVQGEKETQKNAEDFFYSQAESAMM